MKTLTLKSSALVALLATSACTCLKSPNLDIAPASLESTYGEAAYADASGMPMSPEMNALATMPLDTVFFALNSASLSVDAQEALQDVASYVKTKGINGMIIEGHADERGTREYNLALGDRRAVSMKKYLVSLGLDSSDIRTISYGKERPAEMGHNEAAWAQNRRGVIVLK